MSTSTPGPGGLRERKKARTRWAIQEHALRLFAEHGYEGTTVEAIAAAAEVSPSTFFRYFPTKEDVVVRDEFDDLLPDVFRAAGASADPLATLKESVVASVVGLGGELLEQSRQRTELIFSVPALRARSVDNVITSFGDAARGFAQGRGLPEDDPAVVAFVGACIGAVLPLLLRWVRTGYTEDLGALYDEAVHGLRELIAARPAGPAPDAPVR